MGVHKEQNIWVFLKVSEPPKIRVRDVDQSSRAVGGPFVGPFTLRSNDKSTISRAALLRSEPKNENKHGVFQTRFFVLGYC